MSVTRDLTDAAQAAHADQSTIAVDAARDTELLLRKLRNAGWAIGLDELIIGLTDTVLAAQLRAALAAGQYHDYLTELSDVTPELVLDPKTALTDPEHAAAILRSPASGILAAAGATGSEHQRRRLQLLRVIASMVHDSGALANTIHGATNPRLTTYVRVLTPPSCPRCAVLAGKRFSWRADFDRHPNCDCTARHLIDGLEDHEPHLYDVQAAYRRGDIRGLSSADREAIDSGVDINQVINAKRKGQMIHTTAGTFTTEGTSRRGIAGRRMRQLGLTTGRQSVSQILATNRSRAAVLDSLYANGYLLRRDELAA